MYKNCFIFGDILTFVTEYCSLSFVIIRCLSLCHSSFYFFSLPLSLFLSCGYLTR